MWAGMKILKCRQKRRKNDVSICEGDFLGNRLRVKTRKHDKFDNGERIIGVEVIDPVKSRVASTAMKGKEFTKDNCNKLYKVHDIDICEQILPKQMYRVKGLKGKIVGVEVVEKEKSRLLSKKLVGKQSNYGTGKEQLFIFLD